MKIIARSLLALSLLAVVAGRAEAGPFTANPATLNFGNLGVGAPASKMTVTLTNTSNAVATINTISVGGANAGDFTAAPSLPPPLNLGAGATMTVDVTFAPLAGGSRVGTLTVAVAGGLGNTDVPLSGVGLGPKISVTPSPINAGGIKPNATTSTRLTVANSGGGTVKVSAITIGGPDAALFSLSGLPALPSSIAAGQNFAVTLGYTPVAVGSFTATLTITSDDPNTPSLAIAVKGTAGDPAIATDAGTVAFGSVRVGLTSQAQTITVSNPGLSDLRVTMVTLDAGPMGNGNPGDFVLTPVMPATVPVGGTLPIKVQLKPTAVGARLARVAIASDDPLAPTKYVTVLGTGTFAMLSVSPPSLDFKDQTALVVSKPQVVTFSNAGDAPANIVAVGFSGPSGAWFRTGGLLLPPVTVPAMGKLNVDVVAVPMALGVGMGTVTFITDDPKTPSFSVGLQVNATGGATSVEPPYVEFGLVTAMSRKTQTVTLTNKGTGPVEIGALDLVTMDAGITIDKVPMPLPVTVAPAGTLAFDVSCAPEMIGLQSAEVQISLTGDPKVRTIHVPIDCIGGVATATVNPPSLNFPQQLAGSSSAPQSVTVSNTGSAPITLQSTMLSGAAAPQFAFVDPGKVDIAPGRSLSIPVSCVPTGAGSFNASLVVSLAGLPAAMVKLSCTAVAATLMAAAGQTSLDFGDVYVGGASEAREVTLRAGTVGVAITQITSSDPAFVIDDSALKRTVAALGTTSFKVSYLPTAAKAQSGTLAVFIAGSKTSAVNVSVKGNGVSTQVMQNMNRTGGCSLVAGGAGAGGSSSLAMLSLALLGLALGRRRRRVQRD